MTASYPQIPQPKSVRWREFRYRVIPFVAFAIAVVAVVALWNQFAQQGDIVGQVQTNSVNIVTTQAGLVQGLTVVRHDVVRKGQVIATVAAFDPEVTRAAMDAVAADLNVLETRLVWTELGREESSAKMGLDLMAQVNLLNVAQTNLHQAEIVFGRDEELIKPPDPAISQATYDTDRNRRDVLRTEVADRTKLVAEWARKLELLSPLGTNFFNQIHPSIQRDVAARQKELEQVQKPLSLKSPIDGTVSSVLHHADERVPAGAVVATIVPVRSDKIVAFVRQPISVRPKVGDEVTLWTRGILKKSVTAKIITVGTQLETVPTLLLPPGRPTAEVGLPITISLPPELGLLPGETLDIRRVRK